VARLDAELAATRARHALVAKPDAVAAAFARFEAPPSARHRRRRHRGCLALEKITAALSAFAPAALTR